MNPGRTAASVRAIRGRDGGVAARSYRVSYGGSRWGTLRTVAHNPLPRLAAVVDNAAMQTEPSEAVPPKRQRRWFQFSLRTLLIGVTLLCVVAGGYVLSQKEIVKERQAELDDVLKRGGIAHADYTLSQPQWERVYLSRVSWVREWLGDHAMKWIILPTGATLEEERRVRSWFPEAEVSHDSGGSPAPTKS